MSSFSASPASSERYRGPRKRINLGLEYMQKDPLVGDTVFIAQAAVNALRNLSERGTNNGLYLANQVASETIVACGRMSSQKFAEYIDENPRCTFINLLHDYTGALKTIHENAVEALIQGKVNSKSKDTLNKSWKKIQQISRDIILESERIAEQIDREFETVTLTNASSMGVSKTSLPRYKRNEVNMLDEIILKGVPEGSWWTDISLVTVDDEEYGMKLYNRYPSRSTATTNETPFERMTHDKKILQSMMHPALPQLQGCSEDDEYLPFILFWPRQLSLRLVQRIIHLCAEHESDALNVTIRLLEKAKDLTETVQDYKFTDKIHVNASTIQDALYYEDKDMVVIPPFALPGQTENTLSTDADVEALAKSMVEIAFQSKEVQGIRAMNPRPPEVETKLSEVENTSSLDSEDAADHLRFFDKALRSRHIKENPILYGRVLLKLQGLVRKAELMPDACHLADDYALKNWTHLINTTAISDVYRTTYGKQWVAVKVLRFQADTAQRVKREFYNEAIMWKYLNHPNIMPFLGVSKRQLAMVSLWMDNGNLIAYLSSHPNEHRLKFVNGIVEGLDYLHALQVIHGDLKGANVFVNYEGQACLADFGLAAAAQASGATTTIGSVKGTRRWMAPELMSSLDGGRPTYKGDIYALGILIWEVFALRIPYAEVDNDMRILGIVLAGERPEPDPVESTHLGFTSGVRSIMKDCWQEDERSRPTIVTVLSRLRSEEIPKEELVEQDW